MPKLSFEPKISFDGVSIIIAAITFAVWMGALGNTVKDHGEALRHITQIQETQGEALKVMSQNIAVLTTLVHERTNGKL